MYRIRLTNDYVYQIEVIRSQCHCLTQQPATRHQMATRASLPFSCSGMGKRNGQKGKVMSWD